MTKEQLKEENEMLKFNSSHWEHVYVKLFTEIATVLNHSLIDEELTDGELLDIMFDLLEDHAGQSKDEIKLKWKTKI
tara:strand:+ start:102 stop:332 length:231 start_codon:yes stop_codon:yes gene_type:complete